MGTTGLALAAGAIGSIVTLAATAGVRFLAARQEVTTHDRRLDELDEDLERWVVDDDVRLVRELDSIRKGLAARGALQSGHYAYELGLAKERALQMYRDQETSARREAENIDAREGWMHAFWRRRDRRPKRRLAAPEHVMPVTNAWRQAPMSPIDPVHSAPIANDPQDRSLQKTIADVENHPEKRI